MFPFPGRRSRDGQQFVSHLRRAGDTGDLVLAAELALLLHPGVESARRALETMVQGITGAKVVSLHHDISTVTGEEVVFFTLATPPVFREAKRG